MSGSVAKKSLLGVSITDDPIDATIMLLKIATSMDAHLTVVVMGITESIPAAVYSESLHYNWDQIQGELSTKIKTRVAEVKKLVAIAGISATVIPECQQSAMLAYTISQHALYSDLTLLPNQNLLDKGPIANVLQGALIDADQPVMIFGSDTAPVIPAKRVLIAWDAVPQAAKALRSSLPYIGEADDVRVVIVNPDGVTEGQTPGDDIAAYLARHNLPVTVKHLPTSTLTVAEALCRYAHEMQADLVVMGAYGHSRLREWLVGGTTRTMLEKYQKTMLMAH